MKGFEDHFDESRHELEWHVLDYINGYVEVSWQDLEKKMRKIMVEMGFEELDPLDILLDLVRKGEVCGEVKALRLTKYGAKWFSEGG